MATKDVYNMDEIGLFIEHNQTRHSARKSVWAQNSKGLSHLAQAINTMHYQAET